MLENKSVLKKDDLKEIDLMSASLKILSADIVENAGTGHLGMPLGMADVFTILYRNFFHHDPSDPKWPDRDRIILSVGHGTPLLYSLLYLTGYDLSLNDLKQFRRLHSRTPGHPEYGHTSGIEATTGLLGQGLGMAGGMALSERILNNRFGDDLINHKIFCVVGDGCMMEGISHETASLAGHLGLGNLIVLFDDNKVTIDGNTSLTVSDDTSQRFESYGWQAFTCDGHDPVAIHETFKRAIQAKTRPSLISFRTIIGRGSSSREGTNEAHAGPLGEEELISLRNSLDWPNKPFILPKQVQYLWKQTVSLGHSKKKIWDDSLKKDVNRKNFFLSIFNGVANKRILSALDQVKKKFVEDNLECATRFASGLALEAIRDINPFLISGAADVTVSTFTNMKDRPAISPNNFKGEHVHFGIREHAMGAFMNGMALHGGVYPVGGTYLCFMDYARPAIRMAAMMELGVTYVCTHDSIGAGDDGPTHQAVEQISSFRGMPNVNVMRPADAVETVECWQAAFEERSTPTLLILTAQGWPATPDGIPLLRNEYCEENYSHCGAYIISPAQGEREITILATGSEVAIAVKAQKLLLERNIEAVVISMPCWRLFEKQKVAYRKKILGHAPIIAIEAASPFGWGRYLNSEDDVIAVSSFGASAPYQDLYKYYGITAEHVTQRAIAVLSRQTKDCSSNRDISDLNNVI